MHSDGIFHSFFMVKAAVRETFGIGDAMQGRKKKKTVRIIFVFTTVEISSFILSQSRPDKNSSKKVENAYAHITVQSASGNGAEGNSFHPRW